MNLIQEPAISTQSEAVEASLVMHTEYAERNPPCKKQEILNTAQCWVLSAHSRKCTSHAPADLHFCDMNTARIEAANLELIEPNNVV